MEQRVSKTNRKNSLVSLTLMFLGVIVLLFSVIYMISHFEKADSIINIWMLFMIIGCSFVFWSFFIRVLFNKEPEKKEFR